MWLVWKEGRFSGSQSVVLVDNKLWWRCGSFGGWCGGPFAVRGLGSRLKAMELPLTAP